MLKMSGVKLNINAVGKAREAITFLKIAKLKVPPMDTEYVVKIEKNLANLSKEFSTFVCYFSLDV